MFYDRPGMWWGIVETDSKGKPLLSEYVGFKTTLFAISEDGETEYDTGYGFTWKSNTPYNILRKKLSMVKYTISLI